MYFEKPEVVMCNVRAQNALGLAVLLSQNPFIIFHCVVCCLKIHSLPNVTVVLLSLRKVNEVI